MIRNGLIKDSTIAAETTDAVPEKEILPASVSTYEFGRTTYTVRTFFNLECKETFEDILSRLMIRDFSDKAA